MEEQFDKEIHALAQQYYKKQLTKRQVMINPKILILPDIHGRKFYCNALCEAVDKGAEIVCLGDYLDPYRDDVIQIFGHTQQNLHPARIGELAYCLDCRQPFYIDGEGVLRSYYGDEDVTVSM